MTESLRLLPLNEYMILYVVEASSPRQDVPWRSRPAEYRFAKKFKHPRTFISLHLDAMANPFYARYIPPATRGVVKGSKAISETKFAGKPEQSPAATAKSESKKKRRRSSDNDADGLVGSIAAPDEQEESVKKIKKRKDRHEKEKRLKAKPNEVQDPSEAQNESKKDTHHATYDMPQRSPKTDGEEVLMPAKEPKRKKKAKADEVDDEDQQDGVESKHKSVFEKFQRSSQKSERLRKSREEEALKGQEGEDEAPELHGMSLQPRL